MDDRLGNLRLFFPVEVTGSFLGIQRLLVANGVNRGEFMLFMAGVIAILTVINIAIYFKFYGIRRFTLQFTLAIGFVIWAVNIDMPRFRDFPYLGTHIEITAPTLLILYTLLTLFIQLPKRVADAAAK